MHSLVAVIGLLDDGGTVPFIARYRKEATGNLDEVQIRAIEEKLAYFRDLVERRETILASIAEQGKLTDELKARIEGHARQERARRSVPAIQAQAPHQGHHRTREGPGAAGAVPLGAADPTEPLDEVCRRVCECEKGVATVEEALEGARHIVAEMDQRRRRPAQGAAPADL